MEKYQEIYYYVNQVQDELIQLIKDLCAIPSFSHHEKKKAQFIHDWFKQYNIETIIDEKYNVILPINCTNEVTVFCAHIDTVFPDDIGFNCIEKDGKLYAPGVGDDTANVALLMLISRYLVLNFDVCNALIVFNSCEEGLGNLEGIRHIFNTYQKIKEFYSFDLTYEEIICKAVGSNRYRITVQTEGGHSYSAFGNKNAIAICSDMIHDLYQYKVPSRGKSTYNVGIIEGGTSVNTIAQNASFLFEYRSDNHEDLKEMIEFFNQTITTYKNKGFNIQVEIIGERPSHGNVNQERLDEIVEKVSNIIEIYSGSKPILSSGSTDCNIPYSLGIPGCCFGGYIGECEHTREEWIELSSLEVGMKILMHFMIDYLNLK